MADHPTTADVGAANHALGGRPANGAARDASSTPGGPVEAVPGASGLASVPAGASVYSPSDTPSDSLNPRSCVTCRRRKVKCDKLQPCTNCRRAHIPCIFPAPGRAPRRPRPRDPLAPPTSKHHSSEREVELMKRLRKLEGIVEELSGQIEVESTRQNSSSASPEAVAHDLASTASVASGGGGGARAASVDAGSGVPRPSRPEHSASSGQARGPSSSVASQGGQSTKTQPPAGQVGCGPQRTFTPNLNKKFGRLVLHDNGKARYVSSGFWSKINDEINELRTATEEWISTESEVSDVEDETPDSTLGFPGAQGNTAFMFGYHAAEVDLRSFHPLPSQIPFMWQVYDENVNSISKVLHSPTMAAIINEARNRLDSLEPPLEALMFAIYLGAIVSMEEDEVQRSFGSDYVLLTSRYRYALEMALAKAEFLTSTDLVTFQAFVLYVTLVRRRNDTRYAWTLAGLVLRISLSLGLHRDPSNFPGISPFEGEMRRRLFWYVMTMDTRSAEDQGTDLAINDRSHDTQIPRNINDADFGPDCIELPPPRQGETEMTFLLMLYGIQSYLRRVLTMTSASGALCPMDADSPFEKREQLLEDLINTVDRICPPQEGTIKANPMTFLAATVGRVIHAKMTLNVYQNVLMAYPTKSSPEVTEERKERLYTAAIEVFEYGNLLSLDPRTKQWRWMLRVFMQWQAAAYLLLRMSADPWSPISERAWTALAATFSSASAAAELDRIADNSAVWLPFRRLWTRARRHRAAEVARLRADKEAARKLDLAYYPKTLPSSNSFNTLSGSIKTAMARQNWRKLVDAPPLEEAALSQTQGWQARQPDRADSLSAAGARESGIRPPLAGPQVVSSAPLSTGVVAGGAVEAEPAADGLSGDVMDFMDRVMSQPNFAPSDLWPLAFPPPNSTQSDNSALQFGVGGGPSQQMPTQGAASDTPLVDAIRKGNPPPWMYPFSDDGISFAQRNISGPDIPYISPTSKTPTTNGQAAHALDFPDPMIDSSANQLGGALVDDLDVAMETDDFNWQSFNDSIRGFSSGAGGSTTGLWGI